MTSHNCLAINTLHMIKHDPSVLQIPYRLHCCGEADSIPDTIYQHLENKHLLSMNLSWEVALMDVVILNFRLQFKDAINIATS